MSTKASDRTIAPWWAALAVGTVLIFVPEPATTGLGLAIVAATVASGKL
jgi:hypothetical protein